MAKESYDGALRRLLAHEGGYTNHPSDPGGPTNFGITIHDYRKYAMPRATAADVRAMRLDEAKAIYRAKYWNAMRCDELPGGVDYAMFDYGVNSGIGRSGKVLRRVLGLPDQTAVVTADIVDAAKFVDAAWLVRAICDERLAFLKRLRTWPVFGKGWGRRVAEVKSTALAMAARQSTAVPVDSPASGKGAVPLNTAAQKGTAGGVVAGGGAAASQSDDPTVVIIVLAITLAAAIGVWMYWRWRQKRQQEAPIAA